MLEPVILFSLGIMKFEHEGVEEVGMSDKKTKVMVTAGGFGR